MKITSYYLFLLLFSTVLISCGGDGEKPADSALNPADTSALSIINKRIKKSPDDAGLFEERAMIFIERGEEENAIKDILSAIALDSMDTDYYLKLAEYNLMLGRSGKSRDALEKCLQIDPENIDALLKLAEIHLLVRQYKESMTLLNKAQKLDPLLADIYFKKSIIYKENEDTINAIKNLQISLEKDPQQYAANISLGMIYYDLKDSIAIDYFRNAIKINPENIESYYNIAMFYQENGMFLKAIDEYNYILSDIDSTYYYAKFNIGYIQLEYLKNYPLALKYFTNVIETNPDYFQAYHNRGLAFELLGDFVKAGEDYKTALKIMPNYELSIQGLNRLDLINKSNK